MLSHLSNFILKLFGWKIVGGFPNLNKYIIIVAPHTSNWDFVISVLVRSATKLRANFLGKSGLFKRPYGFIFRAMGGRPVERSKSTNLVDRIIEIYNRETKFKLAVAPEGTRKKVKEWKTGFYYIAVGAGIPIIMASIDYNLREITISHSFHPTGDIEKDMPEIKKFYEGKMGKN